MNSVLKNLFMVALALTVSTCAAVVFKGVLHVAKQTTQTNDVERMPSVIVSEVSARPARTGLNIPDGPLKIVFQPQTARTEAAKRHGITGVVKLRMNFNYDGTISDITPVETLPDGLTEQSIAAAKLIGFMPAVVNGQFVTTEQLVEFRFDRKHDSDVLVRQPNGR
jgi:hypothetical protein